MVIAILIVVLVAIVLTSVALYYCIACYFALDKSVKIRELTLGATSELLYSLILFDKSHQLYAISTTPEERELSKGLLQEEVLSHYQQGVAKLHELHEVSPELTEITKLLELTDTDKLYIQQLEPKK